MGPRAAKGGHCWLGRESRTSFSELGLLNLLEIFDVQDGGGHFVDADHSIAKTHMGSCVKSGEGYLPILEGDR
jgi:hypothetical protein